MHEAVGRPRPANDLTVVIDSVGLALKPSQRSQSGQMAALPEARALRTGWEECVADELPRVVETHRETAATSGQKAHIRKLPLLPEHSTGDRAGHGGVDRKST